MTEIPRISQMERTLLEILLTGGEMYGLELVQKSTKIKRGSVYVLLSRLSDKGLVRSRTPQEEGNPGKPRPRYSITGLGQHALNVSHEMQQFAAIKSSQWRTA